MGYLTALFYFPLPGVTIEEIDPWEEAGEAWRRLKAIEKGSVNKSASSLFQVGNREGRGTLSLAATQ
jgi:hypothetical protein